MEYINNQIYKNYLKKQKGGRVQELISSLKYLVGLPEQLEREKRNFELILKDHQDLTQDEINILRELVKDYNYDLEKLKKDLIYEKNITEKDLIYKRKITIPDLDKISDARLSLDQIDGINIGDIKDGEEVKVPNLSFNLLIYIDKMNQEVEQLQAIISDKLTFSTFDEISSVNLEKEIGILNELKDKLNEKLNDIRTITVPVSFILDPSLFDAVNFKSSLSIEKGQSTATFDLNLNSLIDEDLTEPNIPDGKFIELSQKLFSDELRESFELQRDIFEDMAKINKLFMLVAPTKFGDKIEFIPSDFLETLYTSYDGEQINIFDLKSLLEKDLAEKNREISLIENEKNDLSSSMPIVKAIKDFIAIGKKIEEISVLEFYNMRDKLRIPYVESYLRYLLGKQLEGKSQDDETYYDVFKNIFNGLPKDYKNSLKNGTIQPLVLSLGVQQNNNSERISQLKFEIEEKLREKTVLEEQISTNERRIEAFRKKSLEYPWIQAGGFNQEIAQLSNERFILLMQIFSITSNIKIKLFNLEKKTKKNQRKNDLMNFIRIIILLIIRYKTKYRANIYNELNSNEIFMIIRYINKIKLRLGSQDVIISNFIGKYTPILDLTFEICELLKENIQTYKKDQSIDTTTIFINFNKLSESNKIFINYLRSIYLFTENLSKLLN